MGRRYPSTCEGQQHRGEAARTPQRAGFLAKASCLVPLGRLLPVTVPVNAVHLMQGDWGSRRRNIDQIGADAARYLLMFDTTGDLKLGLPEFCTFLDRFSSAAGLPFGALADSMLFASVAELIEPAEASLERPFPRV